MRLDQLPTVLRQVVEREFGDERVLSTWHKNPDKEFRAGFRAWLIGLPWTAGALYWASTVLQDIQHAVSLGRGMGFANVLKFFVGLLLIALGIWILARPWYAAWIARNWVIAVGEVRLRYIRIGRHQLLITRTLWLSAISLVLRKERPDGSGSLRLVMGRSRDTDGEVVDRIEEIPIVPDVRALEDIIVAARDRLREQGRG